MVHIVAIRTLYKVSGWKWLIDKDFAGGGRGFSSGFVRICPDLSGLQGLGEKAACAPHQLDLDNPSHRHQPSR